MKSIKTKLIVFLGLLIGCICIGLGVISFINSGNALASNLGKTLPIIAQQTASNIQGRVEGELASLESIAARDDVKDSNNPLANKISILSKETKRIGSISISIIDKNGNLTHTDGTTANLKDRDYFKKALLGKSNVSDPLINRTNNSIIVVYAVPIKNNNNKVIGVLVETRDGNYLSELTNEVKFGTTGSAFMIKKDGTTVANSNKNLVIKMDNTIKNAKKTQNFSL